MKTSQVIIMILMQQISTKRNMRLGGQGDPFGIMQEVEVWPYEQMVYAQPRICPREWDAQTPLGFRDTNESPNLGQTTRSYNNQQKKWTCNIVDFAVPADHRVKLKESEKKDKYLDLTRKLKKLWNVKVTFILIIIGALDTVTKGLLKGLGNNETCGDHPNYCITEIG